MNNFVFDLVLEISSENMNNAGNSNKQGNFNVTDIVGKRARAKRNPSYPSMARHNRHQNPARRPSYLRYISRILFSLILFCLAIGVVAYVGFTTLQGRAINNAQLTNQLQSILQESIGDKFSLNIQNTEVKIQSLSKVDLIASDINLTSKGSDKDVAKIDKIFVSVEPLSLLSKAPKFGEITLSGLQYDFSALSAETKFKVKKIAKPLSELAKVSSLLNDQFSREQFESVQISELKLLNSSAFEPEKIILIQTASIQKSKNGFSLEAEIQTPNSNPKLAAKWALMQSAKNLNIDLKGVSAREWVNSPEVGEHTKFGLGSDATFDANLSLNFDDQNNPLPSQANISSPNSTLKLGRFKSTQIDRVNASLNILPTQNKIEFTKLSAASGGYLIEGFGIASPQDAQAGFTGPIELAANFAEIGNSELKPIKLSGNAIWTQSTRVLELSTANVTSKGQSISGVGSLSFSIPDENGIKQTLGVQLDLTSEAFPVESIKRVWPFFIASTAKKWVLEKVRDGELKNAVANIKIPKGKIATMREDGGFTNDQIAFTADFSGVEVDTFGELPPFKKLVGNLSVNGNSLFANAKRGAISTGKYEPAKVSKFTVDFPKLFGAHRPISLNVALDGSASTLSKIADAKPIRAAHRAKIDPSSLKGNANLDLVARFDLLSGSKIENLSWNVIGDLQNVSSKKKIASRSIQKANLLLEATKDSLRLKGSALIDGLKAKLTIVEPLSKTSKVKRVQKFDTELTDEGLANLGIDVRPVLNGEIGLVQSKTGSDSSRISVDLTQTDVSLPWVGWLKGKGIAANAAFNLNQSKGLTKLSNLIVKGRGFDAAGKLEFDKIGLRHAELKNVTLVGEENFDIEISRKKSRFDINVSGQNYDARSLINLLFHDRSDIHERSNLDVTASARFSLVKGFGKQTLTNAVISYKTQGGLISSINITGNIANGKKTSLVATRKNDTTNFVIRSDDAGALLSFVDIYRKASGGTITAKLNRIGSGPFIGRVYMRGFTVTNEKRLAAFSKAPVKDRKFKNIPGEIQKINTGSIKFRKAEAIITKSPNKFHLQDGIIRSNEFGFTFQGDLYDQQNQMNIKGTFMPLIAVSRLVGLIPFIGQIFSNGKDTALLGITYQLKGSAKSPQVLVNPVSLVAPGIFNQVFEFQN